MLEIITKNWSLKLVALVFAMAMWIFVVGQEKTELSVKVPVEISNIPKGSVMTKEAVSEVDVRLYGPRTLIRRVASERLAKVVDLTGAKPGDHVFQVLPEDLKLPYGVRVLRVNPARFTITLGRAAFREVPVRPILNGKPAKGLEVAEVVFNPAKVKITGVEKDLKDLDWIWTLPIDITGLKEDATRRVQLRMPQGRPVRLSASTVQARIKLRPVSADKPAARIPRNEKKK